MKMARIRTKFDKKARKHRWVLLDDKANVVAGGTPCDTESEMAAQIRQVKQLFGRPLGISIAK